jgi:nucleoside-diphosphate-sugar epimerase
VDDETPTQKRYVTMLRDRTSPRPRVIPVPRFAMNALASLARVTNRVLFNNRAKVPGIFAPEKLDARIKPMRYSNARAKQVLGWSPRIGVAEGLDRSMTNAGAKP